MVSTYSYAVFIWYFLFRNCQAKYTFPALGLKKLNHCNGWPTILLFNSLKKKNPDASFYFSAKFFIDKTHQFFWRSTYFVAVYSREFTKDSQQILTVNSTENLFYWTSIDQWHAHLAINFWNYFVTHSGTFLPQNSSNNIYFWCWCRCLIFRWLSNTLTDWQSIFGTQFTTRFLQFKSKLHSTTHFAIQNYFFNFGSEIFSDIYKWYTTTLVKTRWSGYIFKKNQGKHLNYTILIQFQSR